MESVLRGLDPLATARITYVEVRAAIAAGRRSRRISRRDATAARGELERFWPGVDVVELDESVAQGASGAAERHGLRSHDAIQLASALALDDRDAIVLTLDQRLRQATLAVGLDVAP